MGKRQSDQEIRFQLAHAIKDFIEGEGYELDYFISLRTAPLAISTEMEGIFEINERFSTEEYPIGIANPAALDALKEIMESLTQ